MNLCKICNEIKKGKRKVCLECKMAQPYEPSAKGTLPFMRKRNR